MRSSPVGAVAAAFVFALSLAACQTESSVRQHATDPAISVGENDIGGVVTSANGAEAGVWVIAETTDLPTKFAKIVVTDERGRYLIPELPKANYQVWVRGYGLVDSPKVFGAPGETLDLRATVALTPALAAQYYPTAYWYSMLRIPEAAEFGKGIENVKTQAEWLNVVKTNGCVTCHQMGNAATRTLPLAYAHIKPSQEAWSRRILSGMRNGPTAASTIRARAGKAKACGPPLPRAHRFTWKAGAA
ncbi:MAG: carboxypeptidase-like regulatory domain-containing protein, partial [Burkholderiales bacterium]